MNSKFVKTAFGWFIGTSEAMMRVFALIEKLAKTNTPVFIQGGSGTGKEICAQALHAQSERHDKPFVVFNCASIPENLVESALFGHVKGAYTNADNARDGVIKQAEGGTLFLDEIADLPPTLQTKLLRFCQEFSYSKLGSDTILKANIRLVCATNKNIERQVEKGLFRKDLYYRLYVAPITMPPLRERGQDILDLANYYLKYYATEQNKPEKKLSANVQEIFLGHPWLGNVRELMNITQQITTLENSQLILASNLPDYFTQNVKHGHIKIEHTNNKTYMPLWKIEKRAIENAITLSQGNITRAAAILDIAPSTIYRKIQLWENGG